MRNPHGDHFIRPVVTYEEKWVYFNNLDKQNQWLDPGQSPGKRNQISKKAFMCLMEFWRCNPFWATFKQSPIDASLYCAQLDRIYTESSRKIQLQSIKNGYIWSRIMPNRPLPRRFRESLKNSKRLIFSHIQHPPQTLYQATTVFSHHFDDLNDDKRRRKTSNGISAGSGSLLVDGLTP